MEELFPQTDLSHYRIISKLGAGGMGEVYLAEDTRLDRKVALKILNEDVATDSERLRRFVQEAKAASALNHPNIITIHEIGETGNRHFIAIEFIDGETLHDRLKGGPMSLRSVLDAGIQIGSALQAAHDANIIHRDIKPENVMVRPDGLIKVLDFGIAKVTGPVTPSQVDAEAPTLKGGTSPGTIVGTAAYMSPEQARAKPIDARTDIFSLGVVLYEMLTGRKPFEGETSMDVIAAILHKEPPPISESMPDVPAEIERIVNKQLRKDCDERYQTIKDLLIDLKDAQRELEFENKLKLRATLRETTPRATPPASVRTTASTGSIVNEIKKRKATAVAVATALVLASIAIIYTISSRNRASPSSAEPVPIGSIAVLPFQNRSSVAETEYLSEGLAESLIYGLSQFPNLRVSPSSTVNRYRGKEMDAVAIGNELGVNAVMTGRFAQHGDNLMISVELVDVRNNKLLWGRQYDRKLTDLLTTQREIAGEITQHLRLKISGEEHNRATRHYTKNSEAYQLYLKGQYHSARYTKEGFNKGIEYFEQAIAKDPNFALAYSGLAFCYYNQTDWVFAPKDSVPRAKQAVENALRIDDSLAQAHTMRAMLLLQYDWNWSGAEQEFRRGIELDPHYALGRSFLAWHLAAMGRFDESIAEDKRALDLDPLSTAVNADLGWDLYLARRYPEAIEQLRKAIDLEPNYWVSHVLLARCYVQTGRLNEAVASYERARQIENSIPEVVAGVGHGYAVSGRKAEALKIIRELQERSKKEFVPSYTIATIYAGLGEKEQALHHLTKSYEEGSFYMIHLKVEPLLDPLRSDSRFTDLMRKVGHVR
ncbi:MAG TPA: protein kinase [Pyrinomonadaceae bacterium]|nr:protein kinase [Pyrinomonadaceae bacterium]